MRINTVKYTFLQSLYWIAFALVIGYSSVYLLDLGFTSTRIGLLLSASNLISAVLQQLMGALTDKYPKLRLETVVSLGFLISSVMTGMLFAFSSSMSAVSVLFVVLMVCSFSVAPSINSMAFRASERGVGINFGFSRGIGSLSYALTSIAAGYVFERIDTAYIPLCYGAAFLLASAVAFCSKIPAGKERNAPVQTEIVQTQEQSAGFVRRHMRELVLLFGAVMIFFDHMIINNFAKQLTDEIGGTTSQMGIIIFIGALVEFPVMLFFTKLREKIDCAWLLRAAAVMFVIKHAMTFAAASMTVLYIASFLQIGAYALFITALMYYFTQIMSGRDLGKGQALANSVITVSSIFASASGGYMIDNLGVRSTLAVGLALSVAGALVVWFTVRAEKRT